MWSGRLSGTVSLATRLIRASPRRSAASEDGISSRLLALVEDHGVSAQDAPICSKHVPVYAKVEGLERILRSLLYVSGAHN